MDPLLTSSMWQASLMIEIEMPWLDLMSSATFWAIKCDRGHKFENLLSMNGAQNKSWRTCAPIGVVLFMTREKTILTMLVACLIWMWATISRLLRRCHWGFNQGKCRINEMTVLPLSLSIRSLPRVHDTTALLCVPWQLYRRGNVCLQDIRLAVEGNSLRGVILTIEGQSLQSWHDKMLWFGGWEPWFTRRWLSGWVQPRFMVVYKTLVGDWGLWCWFVRHWLGGWRAMTLVLTSY